MRQATLAPSCSWQQRLFPRQQQTSAPARGRTTTPPARKRKAAGDSGPPAVAAAAFAPSLTQTYLDLGQRSFARVIECAECGLAYTHGEESDEAAHRRYHRRVTQGVRVRGALADAHQVQERDDGLRIILLRTTDGAEEMRKIHEVKALFDAEVGASPGLPDELVALLCLEAATGRLRGCVIAEPISEAYTVLAPSADEADGGVLRHDGVPRPALCGISYIWTDRQHRRRGVARALLEAVRRHFAMGFEVPVAQLAFSQPTAAGRHLAAAYAGDDAFLVYT